MKVFKKYLKDFIENYNDAIKISEDCNFDEIGKLTTDSRKLRKNDLFIALKGENYNGNEYIKECINKGASICIGEITIGNRLISVKNSEKFLEDFAKYILSSEEKIIVIGITGTNGKTSTKEFANSIISTKYKTHCTEGNFNNNLGLPITILNMDELTEILILEMGTNSFGDIEKLTNIANPDIATITNIGKGHTLKLKNKDQIFKEKFNITKNFCKNSTFIFNLDDRYLNEKYKDFNFNKISFSINHDSDFKAINISNDFKKFTIIHKNKKINIDLKAIGISNIYNSLCAASIASILSIDLENIKFGLERFNGIENRFKILEYDNDNIIINDTYNANPNSMLNALEMTNKIFPSKTKIAILGDMLELGKIEKDEHEKLGINLVKNSFDRVFIYGNNYDNYKRGISGKIELEKINSHSEIAKYINLKKINDTVILIKGSRGSKMENILEYIGA